MNQPLMLNYRWLWSGGLLFVLLLLLTYFGEMNLSLFRSGNSLSLYTGEWIWSNITLFGDTMLVFVLLLPFVARRPELIWAMLLSACFVTLVVHLGKYYIDSPRPMAVLPEGTVHTIGYMARSSSFPSGHTAAAFTLAACVLLYPLHIGWKLVAVVIAALVGISRVVVGIHWPLDVFAGALTGWLGAGVGCYLATRLRIGLSHTAQRLQAGLLVLLTLLTIFAHDGGYEQGRALLIVLPLVMLLLAIPRLKQLFLPVNKTTEQ